MLKYACDYLYLLVHIPMLTWLCRYCEYEDSRLINMNLMSVDGNCKFFHVYGILFILSVKYTHTLVKLVELLQDVAFFLP